jgi:hypothetical protein
MTQPTQEIRTLPASLHEGLRSLKVWHGENLRQ